MTINTKDLTSKQVNDIILLVNSNGGKVHASARQDELNIDLSNLPFFKELRVTKEIRKIEKGKDST